MITFEEAYKRVIDTARYADTELTTLENGIGRMLAEDWSSDRDLPPYNRVAMDGIALNYDRIKNAQGWLEIETLAAAGMPQQTLNDGWKCIEVMTGAILPLGCDTVIRYEDLDIKNGQCKVLKPYNKDQNVHRQGTDYKKGSLLVKSGTVLSASEIGVGAALGCHHIRVYKRPRILVVSTGDELVEIDQVPLKHQVRKSNVYRITALLRSFGLDTRTAHVIDDYNKTTGLLEQGLSDFQAIVISGGVSKGKRDFVPEALSDLSVEKYFHRVAQRPGKPFWFGRHEKGCTVFALPGNPVSSFMCTTVYLLPWLSAIGAIPAQKQIFASLEEDFEFKPELTNFMSVKVNFGHDGKVFASLNKGKGSGDLAHLVYGDAFIQLPAEKTKFNQGETYPLHFYRRIM